MSTYRVEFTEPAEAEIEAAYLSRSQFTSSVEALRWYNGLRAEILGLADWPRRCARVEATGYGYSAEIEIRRLRYGRGQVAWHVAYQVIEPAADREQNGEGIVRVLQIISAVRRPPGQKSNARDDEDQI